MFNDFLTCEKCKTELTRKNQKQTVDKQGIVHSYCEKCVASR